MTDAERRASVEALRWVAAELDEQADEESQDQITVLLRAGARGRIQALTETATMCRMAAQRVERGGEL